MSDTESDPEIKGTQYLLPPSARERTLDEDTKLRRRIYEMLLLTACKSLAVLDGVELDKEGFRRYDAAWERLSELGVLRRREF